MPATTLVKSVFVQHNAEKTATPEAKYAIKHFGETSAVAKLISAKNFSNPSQADYASIAASQQFIGLIKEKSLIGQIEALGKNLAMPLNVPMGTLDLSPCAVVSQAFPTAILTESSNIGLSLDFKKIGGYAIFPDRYFTSDYFPLVEPLINSALINSYVAGENADFISAITTGATINPATGSTKPNLLTDIYNAVMAVTDPQDAVIILNPQTALHIANELELDSLGVNGGSIRGVTVITNKAVATTSKIVFDVTKLILASDPIVEIKRTGEANVKSSTGQDVYLFQENKIAVQVMGINGYQFAPNYKAIVIEG